MASVRARLTTAYALAIFCTIVAFGIVLVIARRASAYRELDEHVKAQAAAVLDVISDAERAGVPLTVRPDTLSGPVVAPLLYKKLEGIGDYVLVLDPNGRALYLSFQAQRLSDDDRVTLQQAVLQAQPNGPATFVSLDSDRVLLVARPDPQGLKVARVAAAVSARATEEAPGNLAETMLALMPLFLLLSVAGAYLISGRAFRPVELIINEVEAITDGRSLHRRLPADGDNDELGRLSNTLNAMIARLETSFGGLRRFTADASHELKTPLTVLRADVERAMNPRVGHNEQLIALEEALQETTRMADLVDSLLTLARADEGRFELATEPVHLESLAREVFETAVILGEDAGLEVDLPVIEDAVVMGDRTRLRQLFLNLITNAIKYTPRGGRVDVALSRRIDEATFTVRDSGIGIAAGDLPYIFERFWRADRARSRLAVTERGAVERGGFGLGLAIAQYIAQAHGGSLTVQSRLGRGTVFTVSLPLAEKQEQEPAATNN